MLLMSMASTTYASSVVSDHFDDGSLGSDWQVSFTNANGWTHTESGTLLTVTDITSATHDSGAGGNYATATLSKSFSAISDFQVGLGFSWDSENDNRAMQRVGVRLLDSVGDTVVSAFYSDAWLAARGEKTATIGHIENITDGSGSGFDSLAFAGNAVIDIVRTGEEIDVFWNSINILSGDNSSEVSGVALDYSFYSYIAAGPSLYGSESIDFINIDGTQVSNVPVPAAVWLFGSGLIGLIGIRKKSNLSTFRA
jgi:hypothetical protein